MERKASTLSTLILPIAKALRLQGVDPMPPGGVPNATFYRIGSSDVFGLLLTPQSGRPTVVQQLG